MYKNYSIAIMIPARLGSTRVKNKPLRFLGNKPLIEYVIDTSKSTNYVDDIFISSTDLIFKEIAERNSIKFHLRKHMDRKEETNDDFVYDFISRNSYDIVLLVNLTSPFLKKEDIEGFIRYMVSNNFDTVLSVYDIQIECLYKDQPINFNPQEKMKPSQNLIPIKAFANGIMGWKKHVYLEIWKKYKCGTFGYGGKVGYYTLSGYSSLDIDTEDDFRLAESIIETQRRSIEPYYFSSEEVIEYDVPSILKNDGVDHWKEESSIIQNIEDIIEEHKDKKSWAYRMINSENNSATLICQNRGEGNRTHYHRDWNEWWYILKGKWLFTIEGKKFKVKKGDVIFIPKNHWHNIIALENNSIRVAVSREDIGHIYKKGKI